MPVCIRIMETAAILSNIASVNQIRHPVHQILGTDKKVRFFLALICESLCASLILNDMLLTQKWTREIPLKKHFTW